MINGYQARDGETIFNSGIAKLMRIDLLKQTANDAALRGDLEKIYVCLERIWIEIRDVLTEEESLKCGEIFYKCRSINQIQNKRQPRFMYDESMMREFQMYMGELEFKYGMSLPKQKPASFLN